MKKTIVFVFVAAMALFAVAQESRIASLIVTNCCESKVDALLLPKLTSVLSTKLSKIGVKAINPYFFGDKAINAHGFVTVAVWELQDSKTDLGLTSRNHRFSIRMVVDLADAGTGASVCPGVEVSTNSQSYTAVQVANHGPKYINSLIEAAAEECVIQWKNDSEFRKWLDSPPQPRPLPPRPDNRAIFEKIVDELTGEMLSDSTFNTKYNELKTRCDRIPIVIIGGVKNESGRSDLDAGLKVAGLRFRKKLYETKKFDIKADDATETAIAERLVKAVGTEKDDLMDELKQHGSPDLYVVWELIHSADLDGTGYYNFVLTISHLRRPGGVFWTGLYTLKLPLKEVSK